MDEQPGNIVIVGGGAGGLELAARLGGRLGPEQVTLVDKTAFHIWKPSLHEVAAGTLDIHREGLSYFMLAKDRGFTFVRGEMDNLDAAGKSIGIRPVFDPYGEQVLPARRLAYGTLILSVGSRSNFFGTPGAAEYTLAIDSTEQAESFRLRLLSALTRTDAARGAGDGEPLRIAIVGAGATGVELAAELAQAARNLAYYGLRHLDPARDLKISVIEGAPRILSALHEKISQAAHRLLTDRGIAVETSVHVASVHADALIDTEGQRHPYDLCVWAAGIQAPAFLSGLGLETNRINQVVVDASLRSSDPFIFAFGDCAQAAWANDRFLPARAQVAHQQAAFLFSRLVHGNTTGKRPSTAFRYRDYGSLVSVGHNRVVGNLMGVLTGKGLFIEGLFARLMYIGLHLMHHAALLGLLRTGSLALGRLLLKRGAPRVKLH
ncbi:MAG TPA: FAD-dependent oxidoreductase [Burkholderiaceae bacterium]|nr:FAD-dependent oxidoreductase [Burkholderiaceae bacterium]